MERPWKLWYKQPASRWEEALPLGNGRLGGMVFGGITSERIQLNEDTLWSGFPRDMADYEVLRYLKRTRELILAGRYAEAEQVVESHMVGRNVESYQPLGDLFVEQAGLKEATDYSRELDLDTGVAATRFRACPEGGEYMSRRCFISAAEQVLVLRCEAEGAEPLELVAAMESPHPYKIRKAAHGQLILEGRAPSHIADNYLRDHPRSVLYEADKGLSFQIRLNVKTDGGTVRIREDGKLAVSGARSVTFLLAAATDFAGYDVVPGSQGDTWKTACGTVLSGAMQLDYCELLERHLEEHRGLFRRVDLSLGETPNAELPTDERLAAYKRGESDPALEALYFQYGRYLLMASSRPGTQPANLQGIWNDRVQPPWNSDYTTNINTQMNYWPAELANLSECHEPLLQMIEDLSDTGKRTAAIHYDCGGWVTHHNVDLWRGAGPTAGKAMWAFWPLGGAWLAQHLWEH